MRKVSESVVEEPNYVEKMKASKTTSVLFLNGGDTFSTCILRGEETRRLPRLHALGPIIGQICVTDTDRAEFLFFCDVFEDLRGP